MLPHPARKQEEGSSHHLAGTEVPEIMENRIDRKRAMLPM